MICVDFSVSKTSLSLHSYMKKNVAMDTDDSLFIPIRITVGKRFPKMKDTFKIIPKMKILSLQDHL